MADKQATLGEAAGIDHLDVAPFLNQDRREKLAKPTEDGGKLMLRIIEDRGEPEPPDPEDLPDDVDLTETWTAHRRFLVEVRPWREDKEAFAAGRKARFRFDVSSKSALNAIRDLPIPDPEDPYPTPPFYLLWHGEGQSRTYSIETKGGS